MKTNKNIKAIIKSITNSNNICLFFHKKPDGDTLGGVFGLYEFIKDTFPKKNIVIVDLTTEDLIYDIFKYIDFKYDDNFIKDSLGILIDIPSANLLKSDKYLLCRETIRIDHHPSYDLFTGTQ
jgi:phosphoesterase RecJ-like protein